MPEPARERRKPAICRLLTALAHRYMGTPDINYANGLLLYEEWPNLRIHYDNSGAASTEMETDWFKLRGEAILDSFPIYLNDEGI